MARLSDDDIERLDRYLDEYCQPAGGLSDSEALDGFLCAVVAAPEPIPPDEWLPWVWGPDHAFADEDTAAAMTDLVMRNHDLVLERIRDPAAAQRVPTDDLLPLVAYPEFDPDDPDSAPDMDDTGFLVGALWADGFSLGRGLRRDAWDALVEDWEGLGEALADIDDLMYGLDDEDPAANTDGLLPTLGERLNVVQAIPSLLHGLYLDAQRQAAPPAEPFRREAPKVGRNDPCPCGSGRKYKHCHGGN